MRDASASPVLAAAHPFIPPPPLVSNLCTTHPPHSPTQQLYGRDPFLIYALVAIIMSMYLQGKKISLSLSLSLFAVN